MPVQTNISLTPEQVKAVNANYKDKKMTWTEFAAKHGIEIGKLRNNLQIMGYTKRRSESRPVNKDPFWNKLMQADPIIF